MKETEGAPYYETQELNKKTSRFPACRNRRHNHQSEKVTFTITMAQDVAVKAAIKAIPLDKWQRQYDKHGIRSDREYATAIYSMGKAQAAFTMIVQRWPNPDYNPQRRLFPETAEEKKKSEPYCYHAIATNDYQRETSAIVQFHNQRNNAENYNKEVKSGYGMDYAPSREFKANAVYFEIGRLAYNLVIALKRWLLDPSWRRKTIATLRWELLSIGGKVVKHARGLYLCVARRHRELLAGIRAKLRVTLTAA